MRYISGPYTQAQLKRAIDEVEIALTNRFLRDGVITDATEKRYWREAVEKASFGRNTVIYDDQGNPSVMVAIHLITLNKLNPAWGTGPHQAFIVNSEVKPVIYIGKYPAYVTGNGVTARAMSLKGVDPKTSLVFDNALLACTQKGSGWHMMTNAEWALLALLCKSRGFYPRGNNQYGNDITVTTEVGTGAAFSSNKISRILTGSGPVAWASDGSPYGIQDLNGNVCEFVGGVRLNNGEIQIIKDNDAAVTSADQSATSTLWKAILQDSSLVAPGTADTLKFDGETDTPAVAGIRVNTSVAYATTDATYINKTFQTIAAVDGVAIPNIIKMLALFPIDADHGLDAVTLRNNGERILNRGGFWNAGTGAGVFCFYGSDIRTFNASNYGFRVAYAT